MRATARRAVWSWITGVVIIFVLFMMFYGISAQRQTPPTASRTGPPVTAVPSIGLPIEPATDHAADPAAPSTTGHGGSQTGSTPADDDKR